MAVQGFRGLGWFLCGVIVAPACYMVNSYGAAEQARLGAVKAAIVEAQKDIRGLETEFQTRASLTQLERWSSADLALAPIAPAQYLRDETQLASLDQQPQVQDAVITLPAGAPAAQPVAAVATASAEPVQAPHATIQAAAPAKSVAQQDRELRNLMTKADRRTVAMVDKGLLSASTIDDLQKLARREKLALR